MLEPWVYCAAGDDEADACESQEPPFDPHELPDELEPELLFDGPADAVGAAEDAATDEPADGDAPI